MKLNPCRRFAQGALFSLMASGASGAFAQTERGAPGLPSPASQAGLIVSSAQFKDALQARDRQLTSIEQLFTRIEAAKLPAEKEKLSDELSQPLAAYAKGMIEDFDTAMKQAQLAAKSQGRQGSIGLLKPFEDQAVKHEQRMKNLDARAQKIGGDIEKGEGAGETKKSSSIVEPAKVAHGWPMLARISDFLISPAHAALAIPVVAACGSLVAGNEAAWLPCVKSFVIAIPAGVAAVNQFDACWGAAHRHKLRRDGHIHFPALMHTACTATLVAKLA